MEVLGRELGMVGIWVAAIVAILCCEVLWRRYMWSNSRGPRVPGPRRLPIIGNLHQLLTGGGWGLPIHQVLARLSQTYGPLMRVHVGSVSMLVASTADMAKLILNTHDKIFAGRPQYITAERILTQPGPSFIFSQPTPFWRLMRQVTTSELLSNTRISQMQTIRTDEIYDLLSLLSANHVGSPLAIGQTIRTTVSSIISRMLFGKRLCEVGVAGIDAVALMGEVVTLTGTADMGDYIPGIAWMDLQGFRKRSKVASQKIQTVFQAIIDTRRRYRETEGHNQPARDLLDSVLLAAVDHDKYKGFEIDDPSITSIMLAMFGGGIDTTSSFIEWALVELLANPDKLKKAQEELNEIVGISQIVKDNDFPRLPYLRAILYEVARLHPVGPLLLPHMSLETCELGKYSVPANTPILINIWAIHRDPSIWEYPLEFLPERFLNNTLLDAAPGQNFHYLPFGSGRRICPAWKLALISAQTIVANLIHAFDLETLDGKKPSMKEKPITLALTLEDPLVVILTPRWPQYKFSKP